MSLDPINRGNWVRAWYAAPTRMLSANLSGRTFKQNVHLHAGGEQVRLHLSNRYGEAPVTLTSLLVEPTAQYVFAPSDAFKVLFAGQPTVTVPAGEDVISAPVMMHVEPFTTLTVTFFLAQGDCLTGHLDTRQTSYISGPVNTTLLPKEVGFLVYPLMTSACWLMTGIDVLPSQPLNAVVAFGSSTTDGTGSTLDANNRWPDYLARRLADAGPARFMSVVNAGIGGNQLTTSEIPGASTMGLPPFILGGAGLRRLAWDAMAQPGATDLIIHIGSNDLRLGATGASLIDAYQQLSQAARKTYRHVFGTTILPGGYTGSQIEQYQLVNSWLRAQRLPWFDAIFDFAAPLASPENVSVLNHLYDSGDGIHPNDEGYRLMADTVDITRLTGKG